MQKICKLVISSSLAAASHSFLPLIGVLYKYLINLSLCGDYDIGGGRPRGRGWLGDEG